MPSFFSVVLNMKIFNFLLRIIQFELVVEKTPFLVGLQTLEDAVTAYLHVCFVANMHYPKGTIIL